ncbi:signal peptidase I [Microbacterium sp. F2E]|uniref:signal peptidase I n=1 Tax=Microbacterium sp. F2E TaxID=2895284 RepID=UPI001E36E031|nr:signal peptidase I [Microbacterium sp. F2E]MCC9053341.1 signal peptidase I [Microbacterium sp. F2E]
MVAVSVPHVPDTARGSGRFGGLWRAIVTGFSIGVLLLVVGIGILVIAVPAAVGGMPLTILTGSMSPAMPPGTLVVVKPTPVSEIAVGDVLTYQLESGEPTLVTHRVVARHASTDSEGVTFVTQGDANATPDGP